jgi:hypothetical protein
VFDIKLEPYEQEIPVPKLIDRIVNSSGRRVTKSPSTFRELVYGLVDDEKIAATRKIYRDKVEKLISEEIANGRLHVTKFGAIETILVLSLVQWTFSHGRDVTQSGIEGRESYAAVAKAAMLSKGKKVEAPSAPPRLRQQEEAIMAWLKNNKYDPQNLPARESGHGTPKALARAALDGTGVFEGRTTFDKAWDRLRANKEVKEEE